MSKAQHNQKPAALTTPRDASRAQSGVAKASGGIVARGSHVGRMQAAAVKNFGKSGTK